MRTALADWPQEFCRCYSVGLHTDLLSLSLKYAQWQKNSKKSLYE